MFELNFYKGKKVLVTGHTGFKGTWLCKILINAGANVVGYATEPPTNPNVFLLSGIKSKMRSVIADIRDMDKLSMVFEEEQPEIVFHLAAQPIVRDSYKEPRYTYETNVMGTVNILECVRKFDCVKSFLNVTTDKVYENKEWDWGYRENENLNGFDPYSNSKSCSELVTACYKQSFFGDNTIAISTARAGNVIGGGDFANDRIIPDCVRAMKNKEAIVVRNPYSIRPYQHVLEPVFAYLMIAQKQYEDISFAGNYNIGPDECDCVSTGDLVTMFCATWGDKAEWKNLSEANAPHEANFLKLDCSKLKRVFGWKATWGVKDAINKTVEWSKAYLENKDTASIMDEQISEFYSKRGHAE